MVHTKYWLENLGGTDLGLDRRKLKYILKTYGVSMCTELIDCCEHGNEHLGFIKGGEFV
jgi:hypothetical protein